MKHFFFLPLMIKILYLLPELLDVHYRHKKLEVVCYRLIVIYLLIADKAFSTDLDTNLRQSLF